MLIYKYPHCIYTNITSGWPFSPPPPPAPSVPEIRAQCLSSLIAKSFRAAGNGRFVRRRPCTHFGHVGWAPAPSLDVVKVPAGQCKAHLTTPDPHPRPSVRESVRACESVCVLRNERKTCTLTPTDTQTVRTFGRLRSTAAAAAFLVLRAGVRACADAVKLTAPHRKIDRVCGRGRVAGGGRTCWR